MNAIAVLALAIGLAAPAEAERRATVFTEGGGGSPLSVELTVDRPEVDVNNPSSSFTVTPSGPVAYPYYMSVYDDTGLRVAYCGSGSCTSGWTFAAPTPNNATRTYTAYIARDVPSPGPPINDVLSASSVSVANRGWTGSLAVQAARTEVDVNNPQTTLTVTPSVAVPYPYYMSVYDETGARVAYCDSSSCRSGWVPSVWTPTNVTHIYTAYVSQDLPNAGPPVNDVRAAVSVTVVNLGWVGSITVVPGAAQVDANTPTTTLTVTPSAPVPYPYYMSVYDNTGAQVASCGWSYCTSGWSSTVSVPVNATRTYTAYVARDVPNVGPPVLDVRGTASVTVTNVGWAGSLALTVDRAEVDANSPTTTFTVTPSIPVVSPYALSVYDDAGHRVYSCNTYWGPCATGTFSVRTANDATHTYTAYVSRDTPDSGPPVDDVRAPASVVVTNQGWAGVTTLVAASGTVDANHPSTTLTVTPSVPVVPPYDLWVYADTGEQVYHCGTAWTSGITCTGASFTVQPPNNATRTYTSYVSLAPPTSGPVPSGARGVSTVTVASLGWTGSVTLSAERNTVDANHPSTTLTVTPSIPVVRPYHLSVVDDTGAVVYSCVTTYTTGMSCPGGTVVVRPPNNQTRTYTAYVSQDFGGTPTNDVRSQASAQVRNVGWVGSVALTVGARTDANHRTLTLTATPEVAYPYYLTVYDSYGYLVYDCGTAYVTGGDTLCPGSTFVVYEPAGTSSAYYAFVSLDDPEPGPPTHDVRGGAVAYTGTSGPTSPGETSGGSNPSQDCSQGCDGDPVNTTTGEFFENTDDLDVSGQGPQLAVTRAYGSTRADANGPFGYGWTSAYDMHLSIRVGAVGGTLETASQVQVQQENGSLIVFSRLPNGTYVAPDRTFATLEHLADGTYKFTRRQNQVFVFDATGRLTQLQDRNGGAVTLTYNGEHLHRATNDAGAFVEFTWANGRIAAATDHTGRTASYEYSTAGNLVRVVRPDGAVSAYGYDSAHRVLTMTHPDGGVTTNVYGTSGKVVQQTDPLGRVLTFTYGSGQTTITDPTGVARIERYVDGQVLSVTSAAGTALEATTSYTYTTANQVASVTDPLGRVTRLTYDARGNRTSVTDPLGRVTTTTYDQFNNPLTVTNPAGETASLTYDARGNLLTGTDPTGAVSTYTVNPDGTIATSTDATGRTTSYTYDTNGFLASATGPDGATVTAAYDSLGRLVSSTAPRGQVAGADPADYTSTATYDAVGRVLTTTNAEGAVITAAYDAAGRPESTTDALGATTTSEYDLAGQLTSITDALGNETTFTYDAAGRVETVTDALGATTTNTYDALGRVVAVTDALDRTSHTEYDAGDRMTATVTPSGARTTYTYDVADQLLTVTDPLGGITTTTYDAAGRPVTVTDADGRAVTTTYDAAGRPTVVTRADASTLSWTYDAAGRVLTSTDAAGGVTTYTYDAAGRRATATDTAGRTTTYTYGPSGLLDMVALPDAGTIAYTHDALARLTGVDYSDATPDVAYTYDAAGQVVTRTDGTGTTQYAYDALGRTLEVDGPEATVGYAWDAVGQLTELTYPNGDVVEHTYDDAGQLTSVTDWADRTFIYDWTDDGQAASLTYPNGVVTSYTQDDAGQVTGITAASAAGTELLELAYGYSDAGLLTDQDATRGSSTLSSQYTWDPQARIADATGEGAGSYAFDAAGSVTELADGRTLAYDTGRQVTSLVAPAAGSDPAVTTTFAYDGRGNRVSATADAGAGAGTVATVFDLANRLTSVTGTDGTTTTYAYDGTGLRASTTTGTGQDAVTEQYTWNTLTSVPLLLADAGLTYVYGLGAAPLEQVALDDGDVDYLHTDLLGSVRATTDDAGEVTSAADYDVYGTPLGVSGEAGSATVTRFGYAGEYTDPTGFIYLRARYYDPATAQFLTVDLLVDATGNPYGYTNGNPLQYVDPLGLEWWNPTTWDINTLENASNWVAGFGDTITFGGTHAIRDLIDYENGWTDSVDYCSDFYRAGGAGGAVASLVTLPVTGPTAVFYSAAVGGVSLASSVEAFRSGDPVTGVANAVLAIPALGVALSGSMRAGANALNHFAPGTIIRAGNATVSPTWWHQLGLVADPAASAATVGFVTFQVASSLNDG